MSVNKLPKHARGNPYTPVATAFANLDGNPNVEGAFWSASGNMVTVHAILTVNATALGPAVFTLSLPEEARPDLQTTEDLIGMGMTIDGIGVTIQAQTATDEAFIAWAADTTSVDTMHISFSYLA